MLRPKQRDTKKLKYLIATTKVGQYSVFRQQARSG